MLNVTQSYVVGIAESLLIELACDGLASEEEICQKTQAIVEMIVSQEERHFLIQKLEERNLNYADYSNFDLILDQIRLS